LGADVQIAPALRDDIALFGEGPSRVVVSVAEQYAGRFCDLARNLPVREIGKVTRAAGVTGAVLRATMNDSELFAVPVSKLHEAYESLPHRLG
jgi:hypothetical protein